MSHQLEKIADNLAARCVLRRKFPATGLRKQALDLPETLSGIGQTLQNNPTALHALIGAGIGGGAGLASNIFKNDEDKSYMGDALTGALAGGAIGGGGSLLAQNLPKALEPEHSPYEGEPPVFAFKGEQYALNPESIADKPYLKKQIEQLLNKPHGLLAAKDTLLSPVTGLVGAGMGADLVKNWQSVVDPAKRVNVPGFRSGILQALKEKIDPIDISKAPMPKSPSSLNPRLPNSLDAEDANKLQAWIRNYLDEFSKTEFAPKVQQARESIESFINSKLKPDAIRGGVFHGMDRQALEALNKLDDIQLEKILRQGGGFSGLDRGQIERLVRAGIGEGAVPGKGQVLRTLASGPGFGLPEAKSVLGRIGRSRGLLYSAIPLLDFLVRRQVSSMGSNDKVRNLLQQHAEKI